MSVCLKEHQADSFGVCAPGGAKDAEWELEIPRHLTVLETSVSPVLLRHPVSLKYGQGGLESFKAALSEHFMSTYLCCLQDRCLKR